MAKVHITEYYWGGKWLFYTIKTHCKECDISKAVIESVINKEFASRKKDFLFIFVPWLNNWYKPIWKGGWHAPIVMVNGKIISQGIVVLREKLKVAIKEALKT